MRLWNNNSIETSLVESDSIVRLRGTEFPDKGLESLGFREDERRS